MPRLAGEREHERRRARARRRAGLPHAAARELVGEGAQAEVRCRSGSVIVCGVMPEDLVLLHGFTQTGASWDPVVAALAGRYRRWRPTSAATAPLATAPRSPASTGARARRRRFALAGYSMGGRLALALALRAPGARAPARARRRQPGARRRGRARGAPRAPTRRSPTRIEAIGVEAFAREWGAQPLFAGQPPAVAAAARADRLRSTAAGLAAALRGLGTGVMAPLWDRLRRAGDAGDARRRRARREVPGDRRADGASPADARRRAGRGHAVHARSAGRASRPHLRVP